MPTRRGGHPATLGSRRSIRLKDYDYSTPGAYFVTICTVQRVPILHLPRLRKAVDEAWGWLPTRFDTVDLDDFVAMPDHIHFIIWLLDDDSRRGGHLAALGGRTPAPTLSNIVGSFKTVSARAINRVRDSVGQQVWQRNFYEHIVRNEGELERIRAYIRDNPHVAHAHAGEQDLALAWEPR